MSAALSIDGLALRGLVWAAGAGTAALVLPAQVYATLPLLVVVGIVVLPLVPAVVPGSRLVLAFELLVVAGWVVRTAVLPERPAYLLVVPALAVLLYLHHSASGVAAVVPLDVRFVPGVVRRWLLRLSVPALATVVLGVPALLLSDRVGDVATVIVPALGVVLAVILAGLLAHAARSLRA